MVHICSKHPVTVTVGPVDSVRVNSLNCNEPDKADGEDKEEYSVHKKIVSRSWQVADRKQQVLNAGSGSLVVHHSMDALPIIHDLQLTTFNATSQS